MSSSSPRASMSPTSLPPRFDGNRDPDSIIQQQTLRSARNIDLPGAAYSEIRGRRVILPPRPAQLSRAGKECSIKLNAFNVAAYPTKSVTQYDVMIGSGSEKRALIKRIWESQAVKKALNGAKGWIFDGNKLAWSLDKHDREIRILVDLDAEKGIAPKPDRRKDEHRVTIKRVKELRFDALRGYLTNVSTNWDTNCLEAVTFLDHLLRETPSSKYIQIKRQFYNRQDKRNILAPGIEHIAGVYQSIRLSHQPGLNLATGLCVNVDVANGTFWSAAPLSQVVMNVLGARGEADVVSYLKRDTERVFRMLKPVHKLNVKSVHRQAGKQDEYKILRFIRKSAKDYSFTALIDGSEKKMTVAQYFAEKYKFRLVHPDWPLVGMTKKGIVLPIEVLNLLPDQRYNQKLDERATAAMIKYAVTPPKERWVAVEHGLRMLSWPSDVFLQNYGLKIDSNPIQVKGRILPPPEVTFANGAAKPGTSGRWDVRGKKFLTPNTSPLKSWGVCVLVGPGRQPDMNAVKHCIAEFVKIYKGHGGRVETSQPVLHITGADNPGRSVEELYNKTGNNFKLIPQLLVFVLPDRTATNYGRIKKSCECRYGIVSQCMQMANVMKAQGQYLSNICLKVNAKLGGSTARATSVQAKGKYGLFKAPTMIMGLDISHGAPGTLSPSMAAVTASTDALCTKYAAAVNTNGLRMEMLSPMNVTRLVKPLIQQWMASANNGQFPSRILMLRDGVSEGQFDMVIQNEIESIKKLIAGANAKAKVSFTVLVATKRHHVRFFPRDREGDRNNNPLPGTLVETGVTYPKDWDFFLCSHAAIKGTARPTHYHVLLNEDGGSSDPALSPDQIHQICYEHVYQYCRATTPVSLPPAVYYAHLASKRAVFHDANYPNPSGSNERQTGSGSQHGGSQGQKTASGDPSQIDVKDLMEMKINPGNSIRSTMWWV